MLINIQDKGKWGYYNSITQDIIPCIYRESSDFINGFAIVSTDYDHYGVIDEQGNPVVPFKFHMIKHIGDIFEVYDQYKKCYYNENGVIVNKNGTPLGQEFQKYDIVTQLEDDVYYVSIDEKSSLLYGDKIIVNDLNRRYLDCIRHGLVVIKDYSSNQWLYDLNGNNILEDATSFDIVSNCFIIFYGYCNKEDHGSYRKGYGIADLQGNIILKAKYRKIEYIKDSLFRLTYQKDYDSESFEVNFDAETNCFVNSNTTVNSIPVKYDWCSNNYGHYIIVASDFRFGLIDSELNIVLECKYDKILDIIKDIIVIKDEDKCFFQNVVSGIMSEKFDSVNYLADIYFVVGNNRKYGIIDREGQTILPFRYNDSIEYIGDNLFSVSIGYGSKKNVIDTDCHIIINTKYGRIRLPKEVIKTSDFCEGYAIVQNEEGLNGVINEKGEIVIPYKYRGEISDFKNGIAELSINVSKGYDSDWRRSKIDLQGRIVTLYNSTEKRIPGTFMYIEEFIDNIAIAYDGSNWGLIDSEGNKLTEFIYNRISHIESIYYKVRLNDKYGLITKTGDVLLKCKYVNVKVVRDGCYEAILDEERWSGKIKKSYLVNHDCLIILEHDGIQTLVSQDYDSIQPFIDGYAKVQLNQKWGLIDNEGTCVLQCDYEFVDEVRNMNVHCRKAGKDYMVSLDTDESFEIPHADKAFYFGDDCIVVANTYSYSNQYKYGIINKTGDVVCDNIYNEIGTFRGDYAYFSVYNREKTYGIINKKGQIVIDAQYSSIEIIDNNIFTVCTQSSTRSNSYKLQPANNNDFEKYKKINIENKTVLLNGNNVIVLPSKYGFGRDYHCGLAAVAILTSPNSTLNKGYKWGFIDKDCNEVIPCIFDNVSDFENGWSIVTTSGLQGVINKQGNLSIPQEYAKLSLLTDEYVKSTKNGFCGLIDYFNNQLIRNIYIDIQKPSEGLVPVKIACSEIETTGRNYRSSYSRSNEKPGMWGFVNLHGKVVVEYKFNSVRKFSEGLAAVNQKGTWAFIDKNGKTVYSCIPGEAGDFKDGKAPISFVDSNGNTITHYLLKNGKYLVDGMEVSIDTKEIRQIYHFVEGYAKVKTKDGWGFINKSGSLVISGIYSEISDFKNGIAEYQYESFGKQTVNTKGYLVVVDKNRSIIFPKDYSKVKEFVDGLYLAERKEDELIGVIDRFCKVIIPFTSYQITLENKYNIGSIIKVYDEWDSEEEYNIYYNLKGDRIIPDSEKMVPISQVYEKTASEFSSGLAAVSRCCKWGFIDMNGDEVIPCQFEHVERFKGDYCVVIDDSYNKTIIDKKGNILFPYRNYRSISKNEHGFVIEHSHFGKQTTYEETDEIYEHEWIPEVRNISMNGNLLVHLYGKDVAIPLEFDWCNVKFEEGFLSVHENGKWGVINTNLDLVVPCVFDKPIHYENGYAEATKDGVICIIDSLGNIIIEGDFHSATRHLAEKLYICLNSEKSNILVYKDNGKYLTSSNDIKSRILLPDTEYFSFQKFMACQLVPLDDEYLKFKISVKYKSTRLIKWGLADIYGNVILEAAYDDVKGVGSGLIAVCKDFVEKNSHNKLWGYVDKQGKLVIDYKYSTAFPFHKGIAIVGSNTGKDSLFYRIEKFGLIGSNGQQLTDMVYSQIEYDKNGGAVVSDYERENHITEQGAIYHSYYVETKDDCYENIVPLYGYDWCSKTNGGYCIVSKGNAQGIIKESGEETFVLQEMGDVKIAFDEKDNLVFKLSSETRRITDEGQIITYNNGTKQLLPVGIHWCTEWQNDYIPTVSNGKWGLLDSEMHLVIEFKYDSVQYISQFNVLCTTNIDEKKQFFIYNILSKEFKKLEYDDCSAFESGFAIVSIVTNETKRSWPNKVDRDYSYGIIDSNGNEILPCNYKKIQFRNPPKVQRNNSYEYYDEPYTWEDSMMDALDGEPDAYWNID